MSALPKSQVTWLRMNGADVPEVLAIERQAYAMPWTEGNFRDSLAARYECWICRESNAQPQHLIGYFVLMVGAGEAHLLNLCVAPDRQNRGLGRELLQQAIALARDLGAVNFLLEVRPSNLAGQRLYDGAGFERIGLRRDYYPAREGREDAIVMSLDLGVEAS